jgi:hypothetical protein
VGLSGNHLPETFNDINEIVPAGQSTAVRPLAGVLPNLTGVGWYASEGISGYNGLQTSFQRRLSNGLTASLNYTYSHALNDTVGLSEEGDQGWGNSDAFHVRQIEYGNGDNDIRHRFAGTVTYALPFGQHMAGVKKLLIGGWQTNAILAWQTGHPFTVINGGNDGGTQDRSHGTAGVNPGADRPNMYAAGQGISAGPACTTAFGHDFCPQALGTVGNEARNQLYGPHFRHLDMSLFKDFQIRESLKLQFRTEAFNLTNTPSWMVANNNSSNEQLGTSTFGTVTSADANYTPREFQFVLKLVF